MNMNKARPTRRQVFSYIRRLIAYVLGMFFIASGVSLSRSTNWGISTVNSIPNVLSLRFPQLSLGTWVIIVFTCFILLQALILLRKFKWYSFLQLLSSTLFGFLVDGTLLAPEELRRQVVRARRALDAAVAGRTPAARQRGCTSGCLFVGVD